MKTEILKAGHTRAPYRLAQALDIIHYLDKGHSVTKLIPVVRDIHAISIGHMISTMFRRELISRQTYSPYQVIQIITENLEPYGRETFNEESIIPEGDPGPTRCMVIDALFQGGLLAKSVSLRQLRPVGSTPRIPDIARIIEQKTNLSFREDICSKKRGKPIIRARFRTIWVMRRVCGFSLTMIGNSLGGRDHTTILNGLNKIMNDRKTNSGVCDETDLLCEKADLLGVMNGFARIMRIEGHKPAALMLQAPEMKT